MERVVNIDLFNRLTGRETLHPQVALVDLLGEELREDLCMTCDFYALLYGQTDFMPLRLLHPGETIEIPAAAHRSTKGYTGVLFHPDLLCDTPLEHRIDSYFCRCRGKLTERERHILCDCLREIDRELHHAIDRYSRTIIASHIGLLLNYCTRFCSDPTQKKRNRKNNDK